MASHPSFAWVNGCHTALERNKMPFSPRETFENVKQFLREVKTELKKVTWPSRKDTLAGTAVVLVTVFIVGLFLGIVDSLLSHLIQTFLKSGVS